MLRNQCDDCRQFTSGDCGNHNIGGVEIVPIGLQIQTIDWPRKCAETEVKLVMAVGFLKTMPTEDSNPEEGEAWRGRLARFLQHHDGSREGDDA